MEQHKILYRLSTSEDPIWNVQDEFYDNIMMVAAALFGYWMSDSTRSDIGRYKLFEYSVSRNLTMETVPAAGLYLGQDFDADIIKDIDVDVVMPTSSIEGLSNTSSYVVTTIIATGSTYYVLGRDSLSLIRKIPLKLTEADMKNYLHMFNNMYCSGNKTYKDVLTSIGNKMIESKSKLTSQYGKPLYDVVFLYE
jgi:hypothetical protein